jgi:hypothetical protein
MGNAVKVTPYRKKPLTCLIKKYNGCLTRPLPFFKPGIVLGYNSTSLIVPSHISFDYLKNVSFTPDKSFSAGVFCDIPLYIGNLYFHPEVSFLKTSFVYNQRIQDTETDIIVNSATLQVPLMIRYALPLVKLRPFINAGGIYTYDIQNKSALYISELINDVIEITPLNNTDFVSKKYFGFSGGAGCEIDLDYRRSILLEVRYNFVFPSSQNSLRKQQFNFLVGFAF